MVKGGWWYNPNTFRTLWCSFISKTYNINVLLQGQGIKLKLLTCSNIVAKVTFTNCVFQVNSWSCLWQSLAQSFLFSVHAFQRRDAWFLLPSLTVWKRDSFSKCFNSKVSYEIQLLTLCFWKSPFDSRGNIRKPALSVVFKPFWVSRTSLPPKNLLFRKAPLKWGFSKILVF